MLSRLKDVLTGCLSIDRTIGVDSRTTIGWVPFSPVTSSKRTVLVDRVFAISMVASLLKSSSESSSCSRTSACDGVTGPSRQLSAMKSRIGGDTSTVSFVIRGEYRHSLMMGDKSMGDGMKSKRLRWKDLTLVRSHLQQ